MIEQMTYAVFTLILYGFEIKYGWKINDTLASNIFIRKQFQRKVAGSVKTNIFN